MQPEQKKRNLWIVIGAIALVLVIAGVGLLLSFSHEQGSNMSLEQLAKLTVDAIFSPPNKNPKKTEGASPTSKMAKTSIVDWTQWAHKTENNAYDALAIQGVKLTQNSDSGDAKLPSISLVNGKPSFGVEAADAAYLHNTGALTGKIAIFQEIATDSMRLPYDPKTQYPLHDEVVDASPYLDNQHQASMPFDASRYARNPQECDTLVIIRSFMVSGVKADVNEYTLYVDTEVVIINARTGRLQHLEYLGKCLADKNAPVRRNWMMRGEAMQYLASLSLDGKPSKTPYESGGQTPVSDADWHGGYVMELWVATGKFGAYNTLVLGDWERNPAPVSQQKMRDFAVRLYDIQGGKIVSSKNYQDVAIENFDPHTLVVKFGAGKATLTGNIQIKTFPGTLTLPGAAPVNFTAEQAGGQACPDCKNTGKINGKPCARCGGIGALVMYNGLLL